MVSNRVAPRRGTAPAGGLAVAVLAALEEAGGVWFGWSGEIDGEGVRLETVGRITYATFGLARSDYNNYYRGFANSTLWPLFHHRLDLARFDRRAYAGYLRVNRLFAENLAPLLAPDDRLWVHDYHLIPLAEELRRVGCDQVIGFFLHTPLPAMEILLALPRHEALVRALFAYDLVGLQTPRDLTAFRDYVVQEAGGEAADDGTVRAFGRSLSAGAFPIGIDTDNVERLAASTDASARAQRLTDSLRGRALILGVDRLDYSKGLVERFRAFEALLKAQPDLCGRVTLMEIAPPSRSDVGGYAEIRRELEATAGHINGRFAELDWVPIRYLNRSFSRTDLACFYRAARVGLVTPLRDGMNLVAKEYVAAQHPEDPGVLVLSRFAGAAQELTGALLVNPYDIDEVAEALHQGLAMPREERRRRWQPMIERLRRHDVHVWRREFLAALEQAGRR